MVDGGLRQLIRKHIPQADWQAIESGTTGGGIPDLNGCFDGVEFWIECKATAGWRVKIRPAQVAWTERRMRHGGRVFLAVLRARKELWLFPADSMRALCQCRVDQVPALGHWSGGPSRWPWELVQNRLST